MVEGKEAKARINDEKTLGSEKSENEEGKVMNYIRVVLKGRFVKKKRISGRKKLFIKNIFDF